MIKIDNKTLTVEEFYASYASGKTEEEASDLLQNMIDKGEAELLEEMADILEKEEIHKEVTVNCIDSYDATNVQSIAENEYAIKSDIKLIGGEFVVCLYDVTDTQLHKLNRKLKFMDSMKTASTKIDSGVKAVTKVTEDLFKNVAAPVVNTSVKVGLNLFKGVATTGAKTGAMILNSTINSSKEAIKDFTTDKDVLEARDNIKGLFAKLSGTGKKKSSRFNFK